VIFDIELRIEDIARSRASYDAVVPLDQPAASMFCSSQLYVYAQHEIAKELGIHSMR